MVTMTLTQCLHCAISIQRVCERLHRAPVLHLKQPHLHTISGPAEVFSHFLQTFKLTNQAASSEACFVLGGGCTGFGAALVPARCSVPNAQCYSSLTDSLVTSPNQQQLSGNSQELPFVTLSSKED